MQTKQGNRPTARDQKGRRGSDEVVPGTSVVPSSETGMSGNFWGRIKARFIVLVLSLNEFVVHLPLFHVVSPFLSTSVLIHVLVMLTCIKGGRRTRTTSSHGTR